MKEVKLRVYRFKPSLEKPSYAEYRLPYKRGLTVLDALIHVKEAIDHSLALRYSCRMASCGSCGMKINSLPRLACYTQISELKSPITIEPLGNFPILRDLVTDLSRFFKQHKDSKPWLIRRDEEEQENPTREYLQRQEELERYFQFSGCIRCGSCHAACPTVDTDVLFPGPHALSQAYRYAADSRDQGAGERVEILDKTHGLWRCHFAGSCSQACQKGVDPALAIQLLRRRALRSRVLKLFGKG